ncbi:hypothetical protein C8T65DRAFT_693846 [Cerioporus squamosus]|nr:hypothetical protein C8T65DRAFT_693846 [Cerioporus squamosus]
MPAWPHRYLYLAGHGSGRYLLLSPSLWISPEDNPEYLLLDLGLQSPDPNANIHSSKKQKLLMAAGTASILHILCWSPLTPQKPYIQSSKRSWTLDNIRLPIALLSVKVLYDDLRARKEYANSVSINFMESPWKTGEKKYWMLCKSKWYMLHKTLELVELLTNRGGRGASGFTWSPEHDVNITPADKAEWVTFVK